MVDGGDSKGCARNSFKGSHGTNAYLTQGTIKAWSVTGGGGRKGERERERAV